MIDPAFKRQQFLALKEAADQGKLLPARRRHMSKARKARIHTAHGGLCVQCCEEVAMYGPTVVYDHEIPLELGGSDDDGNIGPIHKSPCDQIKTSNDLKQIAKMRRQAKMGDPRETPSRFPQRPFPVATTKTKWPTQKFATKRSRVTA